MCTKRKGKPTLKKLAMKVGRLEKAPEIKELSVFTHTTFTNLSQTGDTRVIGQIAQGDDYNMRTAREIVPKNVTLEIAVRGPQNLPVNASNAVPYRIIVTQDRGYDGTARALSQVLDGTSFVAGQYDNFLSSYNDDYVITSSHNKQNPVRILRDKRGWLVPVNSGYGNVVQKLTISISKYLSKMSYSGVNAVDVRGGAIIVYFLTGVSATPGDNCQVIYKSAIRYTDE